MDFTENADEIIIRHTPWKSWIFGGATALLFGGISVWFILSIIFKPHIRFAFGIENPSNLISVFLLLAVVAAFLIFPFVSAAQIKLVISRQTKSVDVMRRRIYGTSTKRFHFYQIEKFNSYRSKTKVPPVYSLALFLSVRKTVKLPIPIGKDKNKTVKFIKKLNKFVKQSPKDDFLNRS